MNASLHTASEIAAALGRKRQAVQWHLRDASADGVKLVQGQPTKAWRLDSLPRPIRDELAAIAPARGCRDAVHLLSAPPARWEPALPLAQLADACIEQARTLQAALATALKVRNDPGVSPAELLSIGLRDYRAAFGHEITERHWRRLLDRTLTRAGAEEKISPGSNCSCQNAYNRARWNCP